MRKVTLTQKPFHHCHINTNITITFTFLNIFLLNLHNTKVLYDAIISIFIKKTFAFTKQTFAQTNYNIYEFMILLNNVTYFRPSLFVTPGEGGAPAHGRHRISQCVRRVAQISNLLYSEVQRSAVECPKLLRHWHLHSHLKN